MSALPAELVLADPLISVPVSRAPAGSDGTPRCPATVNPEVMWHSLGWLPDSLACKYRVEAEDRMFRVGPDTEWVLRLALELSLSSLDDLDLDTWLDVLPVCFDHLTVQERVSAWLHGADDDVLYRIDLSPLVDVEADPDWALESAEEILPTLQPAS